MSSDAIHATETGSRPEGGAERTSRRLPVVTELDVPHRREISRVLWRSGLDLRE